VQEIKDDYHITITGQKSDQWVFCKGAAKIVTDKATIAALWKENVRPWFPKDIKEEQVSLISVSPDRGEYWDQSSLTTKLRFAWEVSTAYVTGQKVQQNDLDKGGDQHGKVDLSGSTSKI